LFFLRSGSVEGILSSMADLRATLVQRAPMGPSQARYSRSTRDLVAPTNSPQSFIGIDRFDDHWRILTHSDVFGQISCQHGHVIDISCFFSNRLVYTICT